MKIGSFKRIVKENFKPDYSDLIDGLGLSLNNFAESVVNALSGNLNDDNINQSTVTVSLSVDQTGVPKVSTSFKSNTKTKVEGLVVIRVDNITNSNSYPTTCPFISFTENSGVITIKNITGLKADDKYTIKVKVLGA